MVEACSLEMGFDSLSPVLDPSPLTLFCIVDPNNNQSELHSTAFFSQDHKKAQLALIHIVQLSNTNFTLKQNKNKTQNKNLTPLQLSQICFSEYDWLRIQLRILKL